MNAEMAARGVFPGSRVADLRSLPWEPRYGTVLDCPGSLLVAVRFDDGEYTQVPEYRIGATGYRVSDADLAALKYGRRAPTSASTK